AAVNPENPLGVRERSDPKSRCEMTHQTAGDEVMHGVPVLTAVEQAIGAELLEAEQILADELKSSNPYVSDILLHSTRFRGKRLRPMLLLLTAKASGGIRHDHKVLAAV